VVGATRRRSPWPASSAAAPTTGERAAGGVEGHAALGRPAGRRPGQGAGGARPARAARERGSEQEGGRAPEPVPAREPGVAASGSPPPASAAVDVAEQLRTLAALRDEGSCPTRSSPPRRRASSPVDANLTAVRSWRDRTEHQGADVARRTPPDDLTFQWGRGRTVPAWPPARRRPGATASPRWGE
jgi:hypothetical protein